jgi:hypothetical protein
MQFLPFVRMVALCNSLSFYDAEKKSDIDIFVITEKNRLFIARSFLWLFLQILGIRRHGDKIAGRFCLSFLISKDNLNLKSIKLEDDIYFIFWLRLMRPLIGQNTYREFIKENKWIHEYFHYEIDQKLHLLPESKFLLILQKILEFPLKGRLGNLIENILMKWQIKRAKNKADKLQNSHGVIISKSMLKFHDNDMRKKYSLIWKKRLSQFTQYFIPYDRDSGKQNLYKSHRNHILSESHFLNSADKKNEEHLHHLQKIQILED